MGENGKRKETLISVFDIVSYGACQISRLPYLEWYHVREENPLIEVPLYYVNYSYG